MQMNPVHIPQAMETSHSPCPYLKIRLSKRANPKEIPGRNHTRNMQKLYSILGALPQSNKDIFDLALHSPKAVARSVAEQASHE
jgi:hypothetical protein